MKRFVKQPKPAYWGSWERRWAKELRKWAREPGRSGAPPSAKKDGPWSWQRQNRSLPVCFREDVYPQGAPTLCAYCDGLLGDTSPSTIDHFIPESLCPSLGVFWQNLFPCCSLCNSTYKRVQWSEELLRPDMPDVERYFDFDPESGEMRPAPELTTAEERRRAEVTIRVLGLNQGQRPSSRRRRWQELSKMAWGRAGSSRWRRSRRTCGQGPTARWRSGCWRPSSWRRPTSEPAPPGAGRAAGQPIWALKKALVRGSL